MSRKQAVICHLFAAILIPFTLHWATPLDATELVMEPHWELFTAVEPGENLSVNCTISQDSPFTAADIIFDLGPNELNRSFVRILSNKTAELNWPGISISNDYDNLLCRLNTTEKHSIDYLKVLVVVLPLPAVIECRVHEWKYLRCEWTPTYEQQKQHSGSDSYFSHNLTLELYKRNEERPYMNTTFHPGRGATHFTWRHEATDYCTGERLTAYVTTENQYHLLMDTSGPEVSEGYTLTDVCNLVQPPRVQSVEPVWNPARTPYNTSSVNLTWPAAIAPKEYTKNKFIYNISIIHYLQNTQKTDILDRTWYEVTTQPFTLLTVEVSVKPVHDGFWSQPTLHNFTAPAERPYMNPEVSQYGFLMETNSSITVYWKPLARLFHNGPGFGYKIQTKSSLHSHWSTYEKFVSGTAVENGVHKLSLSVHSVKEIRVISVNDVGKSVSTETSILVIPNKQTVKVRDLYVTYRDGTVVVHWEAPAAEDEAIPQGERPVSGVYQYTVFWCGSDAIGKCQSDLKWASVVDGKGEYEMPLEGRVFTNLVYGVAVEDAESAGIRWTQRYYVTGQEPVVPNQFNVYARSPGLLEISITTPPHEKETGHIGAFLVEYCSIFCQETEVALTNGEAGKTITHAWPVTAGATYNITVYSLTDEGVKSHQSRMETITAIAPWWTVWSAISVAFGCFVALMFISVGALYTGKYLRRKQKELLAVPVSLPQAREPMLPKRSLDGEVPGAESLRLISTDSGVWNDDSAPMSPAVLHLSSPTPFMSSLEDGHDSVFDSAVPGHGVNICTYNTSSRSTESDISFSDYAVLDELVGMNLGGGYSDAGGGLMEAGGVGEGLSVSLVTDSVNPYTKVTDSVNPYTKVTERVNPSTKVTESINPSTKVISKARITKDNSAEVNFPEPAPQTSFESKLDVFQRPGTNEKSIKQSPLQPSGDSDHFPMNAEEVCMPRRSGSEQVSHHSPLALGGCGREEESSADGRLDPVNHHGDRLLSAPASSSVTTGTNDYVTENDLIEMSSSPEISEAVGCSPSPQLTSDCEREIDARSAVDNGCQTGQISVAYVTSEDLDSLFSP